MFLPRAMQNHEVRQRMVSRSSCPASRIVALRHTLVARCVAAAFSQSKADHFVGEKNNILLAKTSCRHEGRPDEAARKPRGQE